MQYTYIIIGMALLLLVAVVFAVKYYIVSRTALNKESDEVRFRTIASEILQQNTHTMRVEAEQQIAAILAPMKENLNEFRRTYTDSYNSESQQRFSLNERIKELVSASRAVEQEARRLSGALRGNNQVQGQWGEMMLENILSRSGLRKGEEYTLQEHFPMDDGTGALRADGVVYYPDGRTIVIDSKVSLTWYFKYIDAENDAEAEAALKQHVQSVKKHVATLKAKSYQDYIGTAKADFVVMFLPHEAAYLAAMNHDPELWQNALDSRVIIASPTHLVTILKLVEQTWRQERQTRNAIEIAEESGKLVDKLVAFMADMEQIGSAIRSAQARYDNALAKLNGKGGVVSKGEKLRSLGAKATKGKITRSEPAGEQ